MTEKTERLLRTKEVCEKLGGCSSMHIWRLLNDERYAHLQFPEPLRFDRIPRWRESEIDAFIERQAQRVQKVVPVKAAARSRRANVP